MTDSYSYKIIAAEWLGGRNSIGIIAVENADGSWRAYIGVAKNEWSEEYSEQEVARTGSRLSQAVATAFFPQLDANKYETYEL